MRFAPLVAFMAISKPRPAETGIFVSSNIDVRTVVGFAVPADALADLLPEGWLPDVASAGPAKDINLRVTFIETLSIRDVDGKALTPPRIAHLGVPSRPKGGSAGATLLLMAYSTGGSGGPYGNSILATAVVERTIRYEPLVEAEVEERWRFRTPGGDAIDLHLRYVRGGLDVVEAVDEVHSSVRPARYRIYRSEQAVDRLRDAQVDRIRQVDFKATGPRLSRLFSGAERLVSVVSIPWFSRRVYSPALAPQCPDQPKENDHVR